MSEFMTAEALKITPEEREGLIKIMHYLREEPVVHVPNEDTVTGIPDRFVEGEQRVGFNMSYPTAAVIPGSSYDCGSVACIGGHLSLLMQGVEGLLDSSRMALVTRKESDAADAYVGNFDSMDLGLGELFYPPSEQIQGNWKALTPAVAADAIESFLKTRDPRWDRAAEKHGIGERSGGVVYLD